MAETQPSEGPPRGLGVDELSEDDRLEPQRPVEGLIAIHLPRFHLEGGGEMAKSRDAVLIVQRDGDHVEPACDVSQPLPLEIVLGQLTQPALLALPDGRLGRVPVALPEGLDLDEDEGLAVARHEIDLAEAGADVPVEDGEAALLEEPCGLLLAPFTDRAPGVHSYLLTTRSKVISVCPGLG